MFNKIFLAVLAVSVALMAFFTYYSWSWLQSIGQPAAALDGYTYQSGLFWIGIWLSSIILLALANSILWSTQRAWALWTFLAYFTIFIVIRHFWLEPASLAFSKANGLSDRSFSFGPIFGVILIVAGAAVVFFDQFAVVRLYRKIYPSAVVENEPEPETPAASE